MFSSKLILVPWETLIIVWTFPLGLKSASNCIHLGSEASTTSYIILLETSSKTSVEKISETKPLNPSDYDSVLDHCLAAQYFGMKFIYLEAGSGASEPVPDSIIKYVRESIDVTLIVGGGIRTAESARKVVTAGADIVVTGSLVETSKSLKEEMTALISAIHSK